MILSEHEKHGVIAHMGVGVKEVKGENGQVKSVVLADGKELAADMVLVGFGIVPATDIAKDANLKMDKNGGIICNPFLQTSDPNIFAAGDIAALPFWLTGESIRVEHWTVAMNEGSFAAFNMLGKLIPYYYVPFFWTRHYNKSLLYAGYANLDKIDKIHIIGDV